MLENVERAIQGSKKQMNVKALSKRWAWPRRTTAPSTAAGSGTAPSRGPLPDRRHTYRDDPPVQR